MDIFIVRNPGPLTTVQDLGRFGFLDRGVPPSGALDSFSCRIANLLVGNPESAAILEITVLGPTLEATADADIALAGAEMETTLNDEPLPTWRTARIGKGDLLRIGRARSGCRAYLAVTGGFDVPLLMGSRSTFVRAGFGGFQGRALRKGDRLECGGGKLLKTNRKLPDDFLPGYGQKTVLRAIPGPQAESFQGSLPEFFGGNYLVTAESDRMGCRLSGKPLRRDAGMPESIVTEPVFPGNIQVPADGRPIVLLVEQTTGGYAKIATVITTDISKIAQAMPGSTVSFEPVSLENAHQLYRDRVRRLGKLRALFD